jgi:hypothetical protein
MLFVDADAGILLLLPRVKGRVAGVAGRSDMLIEYRLLLPGPYKPASIAALRRAEEANGGSDGIGAVGSSGSL